jgi:uncharacterized protein
MFVGVARLVLHIPSARSLKDKRRVVRSFKDRARAKLPVSIAEVGDANLHQLAYIAVAVVSSDAARCQEILSRVHGMASTLPDALLTEIAIELVPFGEGGKGVRSEFVPAELDDLSGEAHPDVGELPWGDAGQPEGKPEGKAEDKAEDDNDV